MVPVESAAEMAAAVGEAVRDADVLVMAAAVADFRPQAAEDGKIERGDRETLTLELGAHRRRARRDRPSPDCSASASPRRPARASTAPGPKKAAKGVDLLVFNDILAEGVGIGSDENEITILTPGGEVHVPRTTKTACAAAIADHIEQGLSR